jgi:hypothetical protein
MRPDGTTYFTKETMKKYSFALLTAVLLAGCSGRQKQPKLSYDPLSCATCLTHDIEAALHLGDEETKVREFCASRGMSYWHKDGDVGCVWSESHPLSSSRGDVTVKIQLDQDNRYRGYKLLPPREKYP